MKGLTARGLKLTRQRLELIDIFANDRSHPSARAILEKARKRIPSMSASTVYYTLNLFKKERVIKELDFYNMENRYEGNISDHLDLICIKCGKIENFVEKLPIPLTKIEAETGFSVDKIRFEYYGYCKECQKKRR